MDKKRIALITGGMGGLGETITTKMHDAGYRVAVTYSMTKLQGLPGDPPYLVTLNPRHEPAAVIARASFTHPQFDRPALDAQALLPGLGAEQRTHYCGAHFGFGFHEDGMRSGLGAAASALAR